MRALAEPGRTIALAGVPHVPGGLSPVMAAIALALCDHETPVWVGPDLASSADFSAWLGFRTGARLTADPARAAFAFVTDGRRLPALATFAPGTDAYPDRSTTVVAGGVVIGSGRRFVLSGPGIAGTTEVRLDGLPDAIADDLAANRSLFPRGVDLVLCSDAAVLGLPRTTRVTEG